MKTALIALLALTSSSAFASATRWGSAYTDLKTDCVLVTESDGTEGDYSERECKAFGGYVLKYEGGDARYGASLFYKGNRLEIGSPLGFHSPASNKWEWVYRHVSDRNGAALDWKAFIFRLAVANEEGKSFERLYVVRLAGERSCLLGTVKSNQEARDLAYNLSATCK